MRITKKNILFIIIAFTITCFILSTTIPNTEYNAGKSEQARLEEVAPSMKLIEMNEGKYFLTYYAYDKDTKVIYNINIVERGNNRYAPSMITFTQLSDSDGTPKLYKGDK